MLIVGLGNPGQKYCGTRHNIGFEVVDRFVRKLSKDWVEDKKLQSLKCTFDREGEKITLLKPQTYMNCSGEAVRDYFKWVTEKNLKFDRENISFLVVYDDLDFEPGTIKLKFGGSAGGHNGLQDIISKLGTDSFFRLRVGIGHPRNSSTPQMDVKNWVLEKPKKEDFEKLESSVEFAAKVIEVAMTESEEKLRKYILNR